MKHLLVFSIAFFIVAIGCATNKNELPNSQNKAWNSAYGGADKSYDTELLQLRELIAPQFQTLTFYDEATKKTMQYNLYLPENYDNGEHYPLVLFMADASTTGKGVEAPLKQGYGGIIWATQEHQTKHPSIVLVPAFAGPENAVNDGWQVTDEVNIALRLFEYVVSQYTVDTNRLYITGQSMGGMISFYLNAHYPDLFAASIFVGSQWDVSVLKPLANMKFFYIVSAGDQKASKGMQELGNMLTTIGVDFAATEFAANLPVNRQEVYVRDLLTKGNDINFIQFTRDTVAPKNIQVNSGAKEHMYSFDHAYLLESVRDWLFEQSKEE